MSRMNYERDLANKIKALCEQFPVLVLTGARQSGKTTLLRSLFPEYAYVSLDLPSKAFQAENNPEEFLLLNKPPLLIDEVQYAPKLFRHIKSIVDNDRHKMGQFLLTGSQKFVLMKEVADSLAGRCALLELETLSYQEISSGIRYEASISNMINLIVRGQYPELWRLPSIDETDFYSAYLATYLERDLRQLLNVTSLRDFERFIRILASRSGNILNKSDVAKEVGVSVKTIGEWVSVLDASNIITLLEPYYGNMSKRMVKSPKVYFNDTGLLSYLLGVRKESYLLSPFVGQLWETFVFSELRKLRYLSTSRPSIFFYRDQRALEVDFLIDFGGQIRLAECKWKENPESRDLKGLTSVDAQIRNSSTLKPVNEHFLICNVPNSYRISDSMVSAINPLDIKRVLSL